MLIEEIEGVLGPYFPYTFVTQLRFVLAFSFLVAAVATWITMPLLIRKLRGAGILGEDRNKPAAGEVPEMGGMGMLLGFYTGVFAGLVVFRFDAEVELLYLASLVTVAGAAMAGILDDLVTLRQRFKAAIAFVFAAPVAAFAVDYSIAFPLVGPVDLGLLYPLLLVPLAVASAANSMNMLEGFNGLSAGNCLILAFGFLLLSLVEGTREGLLILAPFAGAVLVFLYFNAYPARVFPGDVFTLAAGAVLATAAIAGKLEFYAAVMFGPQILEFALKVRGAFEAENFPTRLDADGRLHHEGPAHSLTHLVMRRFAPTEAGLVAVLWLVQGAFVGLALLLAMVA